MGVMSLPKNLEFPSYVDELKDILASVEPKLQPIPNIRRHVSRFVDGADMDEVFPNVYLGDCDAATNKTYLLRHGMTHVVNAAYNIKSGPAAVNTGPEYYEDTDIKFLGLELIDLPFANVSCHFQVAADFIDKVVKEGGTVLVHCKQGRSRSAAIVMAYLMIYHSYSSARALTRLREYRDVRPNNGFLQQLSELDHQLFRQRFAKYISELSSDSDSSDTESEKKSSNSKCKSQNEK